MKKSTFLFCAAIVAAFAFSSCSSSSKTTQTIPYNKFTSVDRLFQLPMGCSYESAVQVLGCNPYNLLTKQADGVAIYVYKYKLVEREIDPKVVNQRGGETAGTEIYKDKFETVFLIFDKDNKLTSIITDEGREKSPQLIMFNNTVYAITKNESGEYIIVPTTMEVAKEEPQKAGGLLPVIGTK